MKGDFIGCTIYDSETNMDFITFFFDHATFILVIGIVMVKHPKYYDLQKEYNKWIKPFINIELYIQIWK